jgi:hypothetical protein
VASLAQPGGNVTGLTFLAPELTAKRMQLLKEKRREVVISKNEDRMLRHVSRRKAATRPTCAQCR